jgi:hypothetical protein
MDRIEDRLCQLPGVRRVRANPVTGNVLIHFDHRLTTVHALLAAGELGLERTDTQTAPGLDGRPGVRQKPAGAGRRAVVRAGLRAVVGHALVDTAFYAVTFSQPFGLPLAPLGILHLGLDVIVWTFALLPLLEIARPARESSGQHPAETGHSIPRTVAASL